MVFLAWGAPAGKRVSKVDRKKHLVLMSVHPSPLSASRGWFDCGHFLKTNVWLEERYGAEGCVDWGLGGKSLLKVEEKEETEEKVVQKVVEKDADEEFEDDEAEAAMAEAFEAESKKVEEVKPAPEDD